MIISTPNGPLMVILEGEACANLREEFLKYYCVCVCIRGIT